MKILIGLIASLVLSSFTFASAADKKDQSGAADFMKLGDIKGELHGSDMNKNNQAVEDRYRKVGSGVLINTENPNKGKPGSSTKVWTNGNATSIQKPGSKKSSHESAFGNGDGEHTVWTDGNATSVQKPESKKQTCSLHDSVHC